MPVPSLIPFCRETFEHGPLISVGFPAEKRKKVGIRSGRTGGRGNNPRRVQRIADAGKIVGRAGFEVRIVPAGFERNLRSFPQIRQFRLRNLDRPFHAGGKRSG